MTTTASTEFATGSAFSEASVTSTAGASSFSDSSAFSFSTTAGILSTEISKNLSVSSTDSGKSPANQTVPILASSSSPSSSKASESSISTRFVTSASSTNSVGVPSMSSAAPRSSPIPVPISSKNNSPVISLADQTPTMSSKKPSSSQEAASSSRTSPPVVSTKAALPSVSPTSSDHLPAPPSKPVDLPASTTPKSSTPTLSPTSSHSVQTTTSVVVIKAPLSQSTSTITQPADTTLSSAVAITSTNSAGSKVITTPALVTFMSTSTESNGALTTVTHVVANPPNLTGTQQLSSDNGPLHKQGVLAGICVVLGVVAATLVIGLIFFVRRKRRLDRRRRWLAGMQQQRPPSLSGDPFRDPQGPYQGPAMRSVATTREGNWDQSSGGLLTQEPMSHERNAFGGVSLIPDPYPAVHIINSAEQERYEYPHARLAYTTDSANPMAPFKRHSMTPSSPSIYPATLPPDDNERHEAEDYIVEPVQKEPVSPVSLSNVPPRPPRSHLRESAKIGRYAAPLTPPESNSSHNSQPPSPASEPSRPQEIFTRRTILDVRNR